MSSPLKFPRDEIQSAYVPWRTEIARRIQRASRYADAKQWGWGLALLITAGLGYGAALGGFGGGPGTFVGGVLSGVATLLFALTVSHDAAHGAFAENPRVNTLLLYLPFVALGVDPEMWRVRHLHSHHRFPNVDAADADIDENPFIRLSPHQPWRSHHRFQMIYAWALYLIVAWHAAWIQDFNYRRRSTLANMTDWAARLPSGRRFWSVKAVHLTLIYALPMFCLPYGAARVIGGVLLIQAVVSALFILPLIGTHFSDVAEFPVGNDGRMPHGFAAHQILTSVDWSPTSRLANLIVGGLNAHAAHHLFPHVSHRHYAWISAEIAVFCEAHRLKYNVVGLRGAVANHYRFLRAMARRPSSECL